MKFVFYKNMSDQILAIPVDEEEIQHCPFCGCSMEGWGVYDGDHMPSNEICPHCWTQFGDDDGSPRGQDLDEYLQEFRKAWLDRIGWLDWQVDQLRNVLNITVDRENKTVPLIRVADLMKAQQSD